LGFSFKGALMPFSLSRIRRLWIIPAMAVLLLLCAARTEAQSTDVRFPTGVEGSEIVGAIVARDIGDARLTDHFYTFNGWPGDLLITVQSKNLNGDFDVFTAAELRPVLKISVYAESSTPITKNIYLRKRESLILRVEARSPNDDEGSYSIRFSGSFEPSTNVPLLAQAGKPPTEGERQTSRTGDRKTTRVSSVGARIEKPAAEVAAAPTAEPSPSAKPEESTPSVAKNTVRSPPGRRTPTRAARTKPAAKPAGKPPASNENKSDIAATRESPVEAPTQSAKPEIATVTNDKSLPKESDTKPEVTSKRPPARRAPARSGRAARTAKAKPPSENNPRLIIDVKDGSRIEYLMSGVKRVTVENGEVVIVTNDGYERRVPMTSVARMSIGP
jgi:hypothetical protein